MSKKKQQPKEPQPTNPFDLPDGHYMGQRCGFTKEGDTLYIAATHYQALDALISERDTLQDFMDMFNRNVLAQTHRIREKQRELWGRIREDYRISADVEMTYQGGKLTRTPKPVAEAPHTPQEAK